MKKVYLSVALAVLATGAAAQVSHFVGPSAGLNLNTVSATTTVTDSGDSFDGVGRQSWNGSAQAAYGFVVAPSTIVSLGATYALGKSKAGSVRDGATETLSVNLKNQLAIYVEPGFLISEKTLAYGKLSYEKAKFTAKGDTTVSKNISGTGFGFGLRTMLDKSSYLQVEVKQVGYGNETINGVGFKSKATLGTVGVGMKF